MVSTLVPTPPPARFVKPKPAAKSLLWFIALAAVGALIGLMGARLGSDLMMSVGGRKSIKLLTLASLPFVWLLTITWHELGHVLGGKLTGGQLLLFIVGPLKWQRTPAGMRFSWNRSINLGGGLAACIPRDDRDLPRRIFVMIAGGPVSSVLLSVAALWVSAGSAGQGWVLAQHVSMATALISGIIFLVTAIPGEVGGFKTDGLRLVELARGGPRAAQEAALLSLTVAGLAGVRPREFSPDKIAAAVALDDGSLNTLYGHFNAYCHHADRGDLPRAQTHLDRVITGEAQLPPFMRDIVRADYAWLLAQPGGDAVQARAWLETAGRVEFDPATRLRAEAVVLLAEGQLTEAAAKAREGLQALETKSLAPVKSQFATEAFEAILAAAKY